MLNLAAGETIAGIAGTATAITITLFGFELASGVEDYKLLAQAQLATSAGVLYTAPALTAAFVKNIHLANTTSSPVSGIKLYKLGTSAGNQITGSLTIPANGWATYEEDGWKVYNANGEALTKLGNLTSGAAYNGKATSTVLSMTWSTTTNSTGISAGQIRANTTNPTTSADNVVFFISNTDANGADVSAFLAQLPAQNVHQQAWLTIYASDSDVNGQRFIVNGFGAGAGFYTFSGYCIDVTATMPSNASAIKVKLEIAPVSQLDQMPPQSYVTDGNWGIPGMSIGGVNTAFAPGLAARAHMIPFLVKQPIIVESANMICSATAATGGNGAKVGFFRGRWRRGSNVCYVGDNINNVSWANLFTSTGLKTVSMSATILTPGPWWAVLGLGTMTGSPACHALQGSFPDNLNVDANQNPMKIATNFHMVADLTGNLAGGINGTVVVTNSNMGAGPQSIFNAPFWFKWRPVN